MGSSAQSYYDEILEVAESVHNKEASEAGLSPEKYLVAKNIILLFSQYKANLPFYFAAMMQKELDSLLKKEISDGAN